MEHFAEYAGLFGAGYHHRPAGLALGRPLPVQIVDHKGMGMAGPVPPVLAQVRVIRAQIRVGVLDLLGVDRWQEDGRQARTE